jgi:hypothetical protein
LNVNNAADVYSLISKEHFKELLEIANSIKPLDVDNLYNEYVTGNKVLDDMQLRWEKSLSSETGPDFSIYGEDAYLNESFRCWKNYARKYVQMIKKYCSREDSCINPNDINCVVDLGCGCAFSTVALSDIFKNATIYGTNVQGTISFAIDEFVTSNIDNCVMLDESHNASLPKSPDIVFASEFFEHLTDPINLLVQLIDAYKPKYFIFANTFTQMSIGHFNTYVDFYGEEHSGKSISREFNNTLRKNGYVKVNTGFFNNRPQIFMLVEDIEEKATDVELW